MVSFIVLILYLGKHAQDKIKMIEKVMMMVNVKSYFY